MPSGSPHFANAVRQREKRYADIPPLEGYAAIVLKCWQDLRGERQAWGTRLSPIPYTAVRIWCGDKRLDADEFQLVQQAISLVDAEQGKQAESAERLSGHDAAVNSIKERK